MYVIYGCYRVGGIKRALYQGNDLHTAINLAKCLGTLCEDCKLYGRGYDGNSEPYDKVELVEQDETNEFLPSGYDEGCIPTDCTPSELEELSNTEKGKPILEFYPVGC